VKSLVAILKNAATCLLFASILAAQGFGEERTERDAAWQRARTLVQANRFDEALRALEPYATATDYETRIYVARLLSWKKEYGIAERLYRQVLVEHPDNLEATLGLADTLAWGKRFAEALATLPARADRNTEVLLRKARYEWWSGKKRAARADFTRLLQISPGNQEAEDALAALSKQKAFQLDFGFTTENASSAPRANDGTATLTYKGPNNWTLTAGVQPEERFGEGGTHYLIGASTVVRNTSLSAQYSWAAPTRFLSRSDFHGEVTHRLGSFSLGSGYRQVAFHDATVRIAEAIGYAQITPALLLESRFTPAYTTLLNGSGSTRLGAMSRVTWRANHWASPFAIVAIGNTTSGAVVDGRISYLATQTYTAGATLQCSEFHFLTLSYFHENRSATVAANGVAVGHRLRF
jgi:tetratricopeptide (TPR) repeat protein